jgi:hypothetical protein
VDRVLKGIIMKNINVLFFFLILIIYSVSININAIESQNKNVDKISIEDEMKELLKYSCGSDILGIKSNF